jgi:imidazolonepropionase-like amidohydrolase
MIRSRARFLIILSLSVVVPACASNSETSVGPLVAFTGVHVFRGDAQELLADQNVVVRADRIEAVGPADQTPVPPGALVVDGRNRYLMPGLAELHGHIPPPGEEEYVERVLFLFVANGVTTVRGMLGHDNQLDLRQRVRRGEVLGPTLYLAGPSFSGSSVDSPEQAREKVRRQHREGWDLLKVHPGLTREEYDAMALAARDLGIAFAGHVPAEVGILHALEMGQQTIDHLDGYLEYLGGDSGPLDEGELAAVVARTREAGAWVVPTMVLWETILGANELETMQRYPGLEYVAPDMRQSWAERHRRLTGSPEYRRERARTIARNRIHLLRALNEAGVEILFGTDAPQVFSVPGFSIYLEIERMAEAGMSPFEILRSATSTPGRYFRDKDAFGLVAPGMRADLILLEANPLEDAGNVARKSGVMVRGHWLPAEEIRNRLAELAFD